MILVPKIENSFLGCVPQSAWDRLVAKRALPRTFFSKAVRVLVKNCREDDRGSIGESDSIVWLGFVASEMEALIETSELGDDSIEIDFGEDQLPYADALVQVAQDHFAFFSAAEEADEAKEPEPGSAGLDDRVQHLEIMIQNMNATLASLVPTTPKVTFQEVPPPAVARKLPTAKKKAKETEQPMEEGPERFPDLDPGVVNAALQAGVEPSALEEMQSLMTKNPKAVKALRQTRNQRLVGKRRGRRRRAWIAGWRWRSRCFSIDQVDEDSGPTLRRQEETGHIISAGSCIGWSITGTWWRIFVIPRWQEVCSCSSDFQGDIARVTGGDLPSHREAHGRGCVVPGPSAGVGIAPIYCERMGGTQVEDRAVQGRCPFSLGHCWGAGSIAERRHSSCKGEMLPSFASARSELCGQRELGVSKRTITRTSSAICFVAAPSPSASRRRSALLETSGCSLGRTGTLPPQRPGRLHFWPEVRSRGRGESCPQSKAGCEVQGKSQSCPGSRQLKRPCEDACPQLGDGHLTPQQWSVVDMLRRLSFDSNTPEFVDAELMSRAAAKFESMKDTIGALHRSLLSLDEHGYSGVDARRPDTFEDTWL